MIVDQQEFAVVAAVVLGKEVEGIDDLPKKPDFPAQADQLIEKRFGIRHAP
jgi:hypothetical protein